LFGGSATSHLISTVYFLGLSHFLLLGKSSSCRLARVIFNSYHNGSLKVQKENLLRYLKFKVGICLYQKRSIRVIRSVVLSFRNGGTRPFTRSMWMHSPSWYCQRRYKNMIQPDACTVGTLEDKLQVNVKSGFLLINRSDMTFLPYLPVTNASFAASQIRLTTYASSFSFGGISSGGLKTWRCSANVSQA
jgi:hypothetical protein